MCRKMSIIRETGCRVCGNSLYCFHNLSVHLKLSKKFILKNSSNIRQYQKGEIPSLLSRIKKRRLEDKLSVTTERILLSIPPPFF